MKLTQPNQYLNSTTKTMIVSMLLSLFWPTMGMADISKLDVNLEVTPTRCVALRQGQICYQEVEFNWQAQSKTNYCLVNLTTNEQLKCWQNAQAGILVMDFQSDKTNDFAIRTDGSDENLAVARITLAWVFKSSRRPRSSWKLF